jgi:dTDP-4-amino-4,6-dideoxygalactose transaminase
MSGIEFQTNPGPDFNSNYWLTTILIDEKTIGFTNEELRLQMEKENIETRHLWKPMHLQPVFKDCAFYGNNISEQYFKTGLCLPSSPVLNDNDIERVSKVILKLSK